MVWAKFSNCSKCKPVRTSHGKKTHEHLSYFKQEIIIIIIIFAIDDYAHWFLRLMDFQNFAWI